MTAVTVNLCASPLPTGPDPALADGTVTGRGTDVIAGPAERGREGGNASDAAGALILAACAIWSLVSAAGRETRPEGVLLALLAVAAGFACGRICGTLLPVTAAGFAALAALVMALVWRHGMPGAAAAVETLPGQAGASAALLVLAAGTACSAAAAARRESLRFTLRLLALGTACAALGLGSVAGFAAALGVLLCSLAAARMRSRLLGLAGLALAAGLTAGVTWAVAEDVLPDGLAVSLEGPLTANRVQLWGDAARLAGEHPVLGTGPGRFAELSPTAQQALGADGKPHSAVLQQAAEQGLVGVALLGAAFGWLLYVLLRSPRSTAVALTAGAALTALAVLASVGNALSFTPGDGGGGAAGRAGVGQAADRGGRPRRRGTWARGRQCARAGAGRSGWAVRAAGGSGPGPGSRGRKVKAVADEADPRLGVVDRDREGPAVAEPEHQPLAPAHDHGGALLGAPAVAPASPLAGGDLGGELRAHHMGEQDPAARQAHVAAAHFEGVTVDADGHVHEGEGAEQHEQSGCHAADHRHQQRGDAGGPGGADRELDTERQTGCAGGREHPLGPVGGPADPDGGVGFGTGSRRFPGVVLHASSVLKNPRAGMGPPAPVGSPDGQRAELTAASPRPSA